MTPHRHDGSMMVETVLYMPAFGLLVWLLLWAATAGHTPGEVDLAASDAARAAAATRHADARGAVARQQVVQRLAGSCDTVTVETVQHDRTVTVAVSCSRHTDPMRRLRLAPATFTATGLATVDRYITETGTSP